MSIYLNFMRADAPLSPVSIDVTNMREIQVLGRLPSEVVKTMMPENCSDIYGYQIGSLNGRIDTSRPSTYFGTMVALDEIATSLPSSILDRFTTLGAVKVAKTLNGYVPLLTGDCVRNRDTFDLVGISCTRPSEQKNSSVTNKTPHYPYYNLMY